MFGISTHILVAVAAVALGIYVGARYAVPVIGKASA